MWVDLGWALVAAVIVGLAVWIFKRPRQYLVEFIRAGRNKPYSELHAVLIGQFDPVWTVVPTSQGPQIAMQCGLTVTNGGNRIDAPVRGELRWKRRTTTFVTQLTSVGPHGVRVVPDLVAGASARLMLNAWVLLRASDKPAGNLRTKMVLFDRYGGSHRTRVTFSPLRQPIVPQGVCGMSTVRNNQTLSCDRPAGHDGDHSRMDAATGIATTWGDDGGPGQDFLVMR